MSVKELLQAAQFVVDAEGHRKAVMLDVAVWDELRELLAQTHSVESVICCSDDVLGGTPVFCGTRVPIKNLIDYLEAGDSLDEFLEDFLSVSREQAVRVLELAKEALIAQTYAFAIG